MLNLTIAAGNARLVLKCGSYEDSSYDDDVDALFMLDVADAILKHKADKFWNYLQARSFVVTYDCMVGLGMFVKEGKTVDGRTCRYYDLFDAGGVDEKGVLQHYCRYKIVQSEFNEVEYMYFSGYGPDQEARVESFQYPLLDAVMKHTTYEVIDSGENVASNGLLF